jgi:hypothetical protein
MIEDFACKFRKRLVKHFRKSKATLQLVLNCNFLIINRIHNYFILENVSHVNEYCFSQEWFVARNRTH